MGSIIAKSTVTQVFATFGIPEDSGRHYGIYRSDDCPVFNSPCRSDARTAAIHSGNKGTTNLRYEYEITLRIRIDDNASSGNSVLAVTQQLLIV
ncbi:hypothetical protein KCP70_11660 [Salmonella enterica subsp. enterica]|nr:hypothetical protein KCP70_11660 [Salmonella enterica subsp. enterica]